MKDMLNEVKGRRLPVDHPSQTADTFDWMRCHFVSVELSYERYETHPNNLQRNLLEVYHFGIHGVGNSRLLRNVVVADCVV